MCFEKFCDIIDKIKLKQSNDDKFVIHSVRYKGDTSSGTKYQECCTINSKIRNKFREKLSSQSKGLSNINKTIQMVCKKSSVAKLEVKRSRKEAKFNALDCAMTSGMSNEVGSQDADVFDEIALFINQMIPHHQNAVNMCKTLINIHLKCAELTPDSAEEDLDCTMSLLCSEIINVQNHQIQTMQGIYGFESKSCSGKSAESSSGNSAKSSKTNPNKRKKDSKAPKGGLKWSRAPRA